MSGLHVTHAFTSPKSDGTDATLIRPSNWNADHTIIMDSGYLLGRQAVGSGTAEQIPLTAAGAALVSQATVAAMLTYLGVSPPTTGDAKFTLKTTPDTGWVMLDDGTFGDASSGGTSRANADTSALFTLLFTNTADADCPIYTSSGVLTTRVAQGNAATAFAAHCRMSLPKALGRALVVAGAGSGLTSRPLGSNFGNESTTLGVAHLPAYTPAGTVTGTFSGTGTATNFQAANGGGGAPIVASFSGGVANGSSLAVSVSGNITAAFAGTPQGGTSTPFSNSQPSSAWNVMVKL